jgi:hypothetical protein
MLPVECVKICRNPSMCFFYSSMGTRYTSMCNEKKKMEKKCFFHFFHFPLNSNSNTFLPIPGFELRYSVCQPPIHPLYHNRVSNMMVRNDICFSHSTLWLAKIVQCVKKMCKNLSFEYTYSYQNKG